MALLITKELMDTIFSSIKETAGLYASLSTYKRNKELANANLERVIKKSIEEVELVYNHYKKDVKEVKTLDEKGKELKGNLDVKVIVGQRQARRLFYSLPHLQQFTSGELADCFSIERLLSLYTLHEQVNKYYLEFIEELEALNKYEEDDFSNRLIKDFEGKFAVARLYKMKILMENVLKTQETKSN